MTRQELATKHRVWLGQLLDALAPESISVAVEKADGKLLKDMERVSEMILRAYHGVYERLPKDPPKTTETLYERSARSRSGEGGLGGGVPSTEKLKNKKSGVNYSPEFEDQFWSYWTWRGSKALAAKEWDALSREDRDCAYADLATKRRGTCDPDWVKDGGKFVVAAERYLKRRLWESRWEVGATTAAGPQPCATCDHYLCVCPKGAQ